MRVDTAIQPLIMAGRRARSEGAVVFFAQKKEAACGKEEKTGHLGSEDAYPSFKGRMREEDP